MHTSLQIVEIVESICSQLGSRELEPRFMSKDDGMALAALAATCRFFHDPALNALWFYQGSLLRILQCMPADLWNEPPSQDNLAYLAIRRPIMPPDWERPRAYLHRIKYLICINEAHLCGDFRISFPGDVLCPNLKALNWCPRTRDAFPHILFFLGPYIQRLTIRMEDVSYTHLSLLPTLGPRYPNLRQVAVFLEENWGDETALRCIASFVCNLTRLKSITLTNLDRDTADHLGQLPCLESLVLRAPLEFITNSRSVADQPMFASLAYLQIDSATPGFATSLIRTMTRAPLDSLSTIFSTLPASMYLADLYSSLAAHCSHSSLRYIDIGYDWNDPPHHHPQWNSRHVVTGPMLRHLFCFPNVTAVYLEPPMGFDLDDAVVIDLARAWPKIEELKLMTPAYHPQDPTPRVSLSVLPAFARYCPCLHTLRFVLDASVVPTPASGTTCPPQTTLTSLDVGYSAITAAVPVANFLSELFPELSALYTDHDGERYPGPGGLNLGYSAAFHFIWKEAEGLL